MEFFSMLKQNAKDALRLHWGQAVAIVALGAGFSLLFTLLEIGVASFLKLPSLSFYLESPELFVQYSYGILMASVGVTWILSILNALVTIPLELGQKKWFAHLSMGEPLSLTAIFSFFANLRLFSRSIWLKVNIGLRIAGFQLLLMIPFMIVSTIAMLAFTTPATPSEGVMGFGMILFSMIFVFLIGAFVLLFSTRYYAAPYILAMNQKLTVEQAIRLSIRATKGRLISILLFELSFIGWWILSVFLLPLLYFIPYRMTAKGLYVRYMLESIGCRWVSSGNVGADSFEGPML